MSLNRGARLGPYEVLGSLGAGGMGEVYRALDPRLGREVAIKVIRSDSELDADRRRRFEDEARAGDPRRLPTAGMLWRRPIDAPSPELRPILPSGMFEGQC